MDRDVVSITLHSPQPRYSADAFDTPDNFTDLPVCFSAVPLFPSKSSADFTRNFPPRRFKTQASFNQRPSRLMYDPPRRRASTFQTFEPCLLPPPLEAVDCKYSNSAFCSQHTLAPRCSRTEKLNEGDGLTPHRTRGQRSVTFSPVLFETQVLPNDTALVRSRMGSYGMAPFNDEYWDGEKQQFRPIPLTSEQLISRQTVNLDNIGSLNSFVDFVERVRVEVRRILLRLTASNKLRRKLHVLFANVNLRLAACIDIVKRNLSNNDNDDDNGNDNEEFQYELDDSLFERNSTEVQRNDMKLSGIEEDCLSRVLSLEFLHIPQEVRKAFSTTIQTQTS